MGNFSVIPFIEKTTDIRRRVSPIRNTTSTGLGSICQRTSYYIQLAQCSKTVVQPYLQPAGRPLPTNQNDQVLAEVGLVKKVGLTTHIRSPIMSRILI